MKKCTFLVIVLVTIFRWGYGQQEPIYSQYIINPFTINPAVAATEDYYDLQMGYRSQWARLSGAPRSVYLSGHGTINKPFYHQHYKAEKRNWHGVGFQLLDDRLGPQQRNTVLLAYSYNMKLAPKTRLSVGTFVGFKSFKVNASHWENLDDPTDAVFNADLTTGLVPEVQFGAVLYNEDDYFVDVSIQNLTGGNRAFREVDLNFADADYKVHSYFSAGKTFRAFKEVYITPSTLVRYVPGISLSADINAKFDVFDDYWAGVSVRTTKAFNVFAGLNLVDKFDLTFAYEYDTNILNQVQSGTFEIIVGLRLQHPRVIMNPQFWD